MGRKEIIEDFTQKLKDLNIFNSVYEGVAPFITKIQNFPALAVVFDNEERDIKNDCVYKTLYLDVVVYNIQPSVNQYEDVLSDIVEQLDNFINQYTNDTVYDCRVTRISGDKGEILPRQVFLLEVELKYL